MSQEARRRILMNSVIFAGSVGFLGLVLTLPTEGPVEPASTASESRPIQQQDPVARESGAIEAAVQKAKECASLLRPHWDAFQSFKNSREFARVGFSQGYPYSRWLDGVYSLREEIFNPNLSDFDRMKNAVCGRWDITTVPGVPGIPAASPHPDDLRQVAKGVFSKSNITKRISEQKPREIEVFLDWAEALH